MQRTYDLEAKLGAAMLKRCMAVGIGVSLFSFLLFFVSVFSTVPSGSIFSKGKLIVGFLLLFFISLSAVVFLFYPLSRKSFLFLQKSVRIFWAVYGVVVFLFSFSLPVIIGIGIMLIFLAVFSVVSLLDSKFFLLFFFEQWILLFLYCVFRKSFTFEVLMFSVLFAVMCLVIRYSTYRSFCQKHSLLAKVREMTDESETDALTGLMNRKGLDRFLSTFLPESERNRYMIALAVVDIDNFKLYNDKFGHPQGDECLKKVGAAIKNACAGSGEVFRIGGEELLVLFYGKIAFTESHFVKKAVSILKSVSDLKLEHSDRSSIPYVTVSMGLHVYTPSVNVTYEDAYSFADKALYLVKQNGRNGVVCNGRLYRSE